MIKIEIKKKNDESMTFRLPKSLKLKLPGAYEEEGRVKFKDGKAIGSLMRQLTQAYVEGQLSNVNGEVKTLREGALNLLKLMSIVKPSKKEMEGVNMKAIKELEPILGGGK